MLSLLTVFLGAANPAMGQDYKIAALTPDREMLRLAELPTVLPPDERARYERIFALQERGAWHAADAEIAGLEDRLLLGEVLAQRYLGKTYHAGYGELVRWLERYADEPDAKSIYALALEH
ncbi:MAG: lytic transglycosylase domain-containing protein, partial [Stellaceae bacterium]